MKVLKFGGTSVGSAQRMQDVCKLITSDGESKIVVLSAMSGTTNTLVEIADYLYKKNSEGANDVINRLEQKYLGHIDQLYSTDEWRQRTEAFLQEEFNYLRSFTKMLFTSFEEKVILAQGEIISTNMVTNYLKEQGYFANRSNRANFTYVDYQNNIYISDDAPAEYVGRYREDLGEEEYLRSCREHALPVGFESMDYEEFLVQRRVLMAQLVKDGFEKL